MKNILITGSSGGIGTVLVNRLLQDGYKVTGIDTNQPQLSSNEENFSDTANKSLRDTPNCLA